MKVTNDKESTLRFLLIEDSDADATLTILRLRKEYSQLIYERVETATAMREALKDKTWDIIISDFNLPEFSGPEAFSIVKELGLDIPFIIVSGTVGEEVAVEAMRSGVQDYLVKGNLARLAAVVRREIQESKSRKNRIESERRLFETNRRFQLLVDSIHDYAIFMLDSKGLIQSWSAGGEEVLVYSPSEVLGEHFSKLFPAAEEYRNNANGWLNQARLRMRSEMGSWCRRKDGSLFWGEVTIHFIDDQEDETEELATRGFAVMMHDSTSKKQAEDQLIKAKEAALSASNLKSQFIANVSHEIRTPLGGVISASELLLETDLDYWQKEYTRIIYNSGKRLLTVVNDVLDFSKIESGKLEFEVREFSLSTFLKDQLTLFNVQTQQKNLMLESSFDPRLPDRVKSDPNRLAQVLINLINNAIKFTEKGGVHVSVVLAEADPRENLSFEGRNVEIGPQMLFRVKDTGIGLSTEDQVKVFQPFIQADGSTTRQYGGTGLGLSISKHLVELMHGSIGVASEVGVGSTFWFKVPLQWVENKGLGKE